MPLNSTQAEIVRQAAADTVKKIRLEKRMSSDLKRFFTQMSADLAIVYATTGNALDANLYTDDLRGILSAQYTRTSRVFSGQITRFLKKAKKSEQIIIDLNAIARSRNITFRELVLEIEALTRIQVQEFIVRSVAVDVAEITNTNRKQVNKVIDNSINSLTESLERTPTRREVAAASSKDFRRLSKGRTRTIAATTTQRAAEATKDIERSTFFRARNSFESREIGIPPLDPEPFWITQGDSLVRGSHLSADFQKRQNGSFTVQNELLKFPGDRSLGATAGNTINCRCSSVTSIT